MPAGILTIVVFLAAMIAVDFLPFPGKYRKIASESDSSAKAFSTDEIFYLAGKKLPAAAILISTAATNFSAFTILGLAGAGFRTGFAFYPVMAFGTGFMALGMYLTGIPLNRLGKQRGYISQVDFVRDRFGSDRLARVYALLLVLLTLPYLALQPMAAGMLLESSFGIPYTAGTVACSLTVLIYTVKGGMRAVVRTDLLQGLIILVLTAAAYMAVMRASGGAAEANRTSADVFPGLFSRTGRSGNMSPMVLAGYYLLWFFADPMFPQINQRLLAAGTPDTIKKTVTVYPLITMLLFFLTISLGVTGAGVFPDLNSGSADRIWPILLTESVSPFLVSIFMIAPIAAIMSTFDSQLLSLSSLVTRDLAGKPDAGIKAVRAATAAAAAAGLIIALFPPSDILNFISRTSFLGFASLSPLVFGGLYLRRMNTVGAVFSMAAGAVLTILSGVNVLETGSLPPVFIVCGAAWAAAFAGSEAERWVRLLTRRRLNTMKALPVVRTAEMLPGPWLFLFILLFLAGCDIPGFLMAFDGNGTGPFFLPYWLYYHAGLCLILSFAYRRFLKRKSCIL